MNRKSAVAFEPPAPYNERNLAGCSSVWLERVPWRTRALVQVQSPRVDLRGLRQMAVPPLGADGGLLAQEGLDQGLVAVSAAGNDAETAFIIPGRPGDAVLFQDGTHVAIPPQPGLPAPSIAPHSPQ